MMDNALHLTRRAVEVAIDASRDRRRAWVVRPKNYETTCHHSRSDPADRLQSAARRIEIRRAEHYRKRHIQAGRARRPALGRGYSFSARGCQSPRIRYRDTREQMGQSPKMG